MIKRIVSKPIIDFSMDPEHLKNINGPSAIRVPDWCENALGKYYLYFAHHQGKFIRLAYADSIEGPWTIHKAGTLQLEQTHFINHIASPDVHIDHENQKIIMYYHGVLPTRFDEFCPQRTGVATSKNGIDFESVNTKFLGPFYFRVFEHEGWKYAISKTIYEGSGGLLLRNKDGFSEFEIGPKILERQRHVALHKIGDTLDIYYTRIDDNPESVLLAKMDLKGDWKEWHTSEPKLILQPETDYEGANLEPEASREGAIHKPARQLRDPDILIDEGSKYMFYSCAGETSISVVQLVDN
jgi:hypothetical protein